MAGDEDASKVEDDDSDDSVDITVDAAALVVWVSEVGVDVDEISDMVNVLEKVEPKTADGVPDTVVDTISPMSTRGPSVTNGSLEQSHELVLAASQQKVVFDSKLEHRLTMLPVSVLKGSARVSVSAIFTTPPFSPTYLRRKTGDNCHRTRSNRCRCRG